MNVQRSRDSQRIDIGEVNRARALSDSTRIKLLELLLASTGPRRVSELARELDLHHTVVRQHLKILSLAGLVASEPLPVSSRGRPSSGWRASTAVSNPYQWLSEKLAEAMREGFSPHDEGFATGRRLAHAETNGVDVIMSEAEKMGFHPRRDRREGARVDIVLERCPFAEVADLDPGVVCALHHGLASGIASVCGDVVVERLDVRPPRVAGCRLVLRAT